MMSLDVSGVSLCDQAHKALELYLFQNQPKENSVETTKFVCRDVGCDHSLEILLYLRVSPPSINWSYKPGLLQ